MHLKVVLTGASGYVGSQLLKLLPLKGLTVLPVYRIRDKRREGDTLFLDDVIQGRLPGGIDTIIHCAALTRSHSYEALKSANENLTTALSGICKKKNIPLIFLSTNLAKRGLGHYGASKLACERIISKIGIPALVLRLGPVLGEVNPSANSTISKIIDSVKRTHFVMIPFGSGPRLAPTWINDVSEYMANWIKLNQKAFIIAETSGEEIDYHTLITSIEEELRVKRVKIPIPLKTISRLAKLTLLLPVLRDLPLDSIRFLYDMVQDSTDMDLPLTWSPTPFRTALRRSIRGK